MSPIRVAAISYDWYPFEARALRLAETVADAGFDMDVVCIRRGNEPSSDTHNGVRIYRLPIRRGYGSSLPVMVVGWCWFMLLAALKLGQLHLKRRYDVIHVHNMPDFLVFSAIIPKLLGARVILDVQDVSPELMAAKARGRLRAKLLRRLAIWQEQISAAFADHVLTVGWPFEELLLKRGIRPDKVSSILNSADPKVFPASRRYPAPALTPGANRPFIVMYWGTVAERNGVDTAMRAVALARSSIPGIRFDIIGRGEKLQEIRQLASELGISDQVVFGDPVPSEQIVDFVLHGDVGIIPYRVNGFAELVLPTKAYELAWMERPIVASDTPAIRSMFRPESIALCKPGSPESFSEALIALYQHPERRVHMVRNAAEDYVRFRWEEMAERYREILVSLSRGRQVVRHQTGILSAQADGHRQ